MMTNRKAGGTVSLRVQTWDGLDALVGIKKYPNRSAIIEFLALREVKRNKEEVEAWLLKNRNKKI